MATVTKSIGTTGRNYSTITAWEADLDNAGVYSAGDNAVGECYNDSNFDESVVFDGGGTVGLASRKLTVAAGERHDGIAGTGARIVSSVARWFSVTIKPMIIEWIEFDSNDKNSSYRKGLIHKSGSSGTSNHITVNNCILHDFVGPSSFAGRGALYAEDDAMTAHNNVIYNLTSSDSGQAVNGIACLGTSEEQNIYNNTIYNVSAAGSNYGIYFNSNYATKYCTNNVVCTVGGSCYSFPGTTINSETNLSSDDTADDAGGSGHLLNKTASNQFASTAAGYEDLHLKTGADAIDVATDLGTTPTGVNIDIDGRDRDAEGDTWDMGADEYVSVGGAIAPTSVFYGSLVGPFGGPI